MTTRPLFIGAARALDASGNVARLEIPTHHLTTHSVIVGMTGSGKTGLAMTLVEETLRSKIPVLMIDVKGDLPNLFYAFPSLSPCEFEPYVDPEMVEREGRTVAETAKDLAQTRAKGLNGRARITVGVDLAGTAPGRTRSRCDPQSRPRAARAFRRTETSLEPTGRHRVPN